MSEKKIIKQIFISVIRVRRTTHLVMKYPRGGAFGYSSDITSFSLNSPPAKGVPSGPVMIA